MLNGRMTDEWMNWEGSSYDLIVVGGWSDENTVKHSARVSLYVLCCVADSLQVLCDRADSLFVLCHCADVCSICDALLSVPTHT